jgi:hypothetical protein
MTPSEQKIILYLEKLNELNAEGCLRATENLPWGKRLFWHAGRGKAQSISTKMKRFSIKKPHCITNVDVTLIERKFRTPHRY